MDDIRMPQVGTLCQMLWRALDAQGAVDFPHPGSRATRMTSISSSRSHNPECTSTWYATRLHGAALHTSDE